jgi:hypothetical protein
MQIFIVTKSKEVKTGWSNSRQIWQYLRRKVVAKKRTVLPMMEIPSIIPL